jgi:hypothetical protein
VTALCEQLILPGVKNPKGPGRRPSTPSEYWAGFFARVKAAREAAGFSQAHVARLLTDRVGREIAPDTYRKWESESGMPHDVVIPFAYITGVDAYELLSGEPYRIGKVIPFPGTHRKISGN